MAAPPEKIEPPQSSRIVSLVLGAIIIGVAIAAFGAIPRVLDVLEVLEIAVRSPQPLTLVGGSACIYGTARRRASICAIVKGVL